MTEAGDEFETFLKTRTLLPNGMSDDDKLEPPKAVDAIVLKEAREAIRAREQLNRTPRWATPVALAATILLCLSVVLNVSLNTNRPKANLQQMTAATADRASPTSASPVPEGERGKKVGDAIAEQHAPRPPVAAEAAMPAPSASPRPESSAADEADALANRSGTRVRALRQATSTTASGADKAAQLAEHSRTSAESPGGPTAAAPPVGGVAEMREGDQPALSKSEAAPAAAPPHPQDPKTWLQQIAALRAEGKTEEADAEMQRFRAAFPAYSAKPTPTPSEPPK